jgi:uncharacterized protein
MVAVTGPLANCRLRGAHTGEVRIAVQVRPRSAHPGVGGEHDGSLVVRVSVPAADGKATAAALASVAAAFGVSRTSVTLVAGARSRVKILDVAGADPGTLERLLAQ